MPEVYVHAIEGRTKEQKRALIKEITDAVVKEPVLHADPRFDGFVAKYMGDRVLAYFGARVPTKTTRSRRCEPA